jgi:hypothetical protein
MEANAAIWTPDDNHFCFYFLCDFIFLPMGNRYLLVKCFLVVYFTMLLSSQTILTSNSMSG